MTGENAKDTITMQYVPIDAKDGSGGFAAYMAKPREEQLPAPVIIVIQEIFGVNADMRAKCDLFAQKGFIAICPDLFWRQKPGVELTDKTREEWDQAFALMNGFDIGKGIEDLDATLAYARGMNDSNRRVGCVGYCLGGKLAYLMASRTDIDASVGYYGVGLDSLLNEAGDIKKPLMLHIAEMDKFSTPDARDAVLDKFAPSKIVTAHLYKGVDHAFARQNGEHYDAGAATLANGRTDAFFVANLKG